MLLANVILLVVVAGFVVNNPSTEVASQQSILTLNEESQPINPLDQLSSADIAAQVADITQLPERNSVFNNADSIKAQLAIVPADTTVVAKPQVVSNIQKTRKDIVSYVTKNGDTVASVAAKFNVTSDSVRWSNGLTGNFLAAGSTLWISPISNGIVYVVQAGDTADSIASHFGTNRESVITFNDGELSGFKPGERIVVPNGQIASTPQQSFSDFVWGGSAPIYSSNGYDYGWCTWHAANRRAASGRPLPSNLGNAVTWVSQARAFGMPVDDNPSAGDVIYYRNIGGLGHVGYVEKKNSDGSILVSDMNYPIWGSVTYHTVSPSNFGDYYFIH